ncbi:MAG: hypothetical protein BRD48_01870 [Bacteroidetes bacterium QS_9_68_14]|nr:MAG: hypothetical protein BRD48_01870 [Bacteroidetes bacterium QS_9_68_14]
MNDSSYRLPGGPPVLERDLPLWGGALLALVLAAGCATLFGERAEDDFDVSQGEVATRALPSTRNLAHDPDSLAHLKLVGKDGKIDFQLDKSYRALLTEWSAAQQGGTGAYFRTHAMLWSKELSLASLIPERGVQTLSKDLARDMIEERTADYDSTLQIDVFVFTRSRRRLDLSALQLDSAGQRVYLRDGDNTRYEPVRIVSTAPLEAYQAGRQALYGHNQIFFDRYTEDGTDLLDTEELRLYTDHAEYFTWTFPERAAPVASPSEQVSLEER